MRLAVAGLTLALLLLGATAPAAAPVSPLFLGAELEVQLSVDSRLMDAKPVTSSPSGTPTASACSSAPTHFQSDAAQGAWFRFRDDAREKSCGEAVFTFDVPDGATDMRVRFHVDRVVVQSSSVPNYQIPIAFTQEVRTYYSEGGGLKSSHPTFDRDRGSDNKSEDFTDHLDGAKQILVSWYFQDESPGPNLGSAGVGLPTNAVADQNITVTVRDATVSFLGIPTEPLEVTEASAAEGNGVTRHTMTVVLPLEQPTSGHVGAAVKTSSILGLAYITDPLGSQVSPRSIATDTDTRTTTTILDPEAVARQGYGEYRFTFTSAQPLDAALGMTILVIAMLLLPGVMAVLSIRQWLHLRRQAGASYPHVAQQYLWALLLAQAVYLIVLVWVLVTQPFPLLVAWPMQSQAVLLLGILLACTGAFFALAFLAKGRLVRLAEADLAAKRRANLELERSNRDLEQFAYVASHDLQEPLRAVAGYTQLLQHRYGDRLDPQAQQYIKNAVDGADRMLGLIHGLLAYARIGTDSAKAAPVDLEVTLGEALGNLDVPLQESKGKVTHGPLPVVHADRAQAVQLLQNLVANALKFHAPGKAPRIHLEARETGTGEWTVEVRDNGIGIPAEHQHRIFQIFQRLHPRDRYPGSGLGLAICQRIVERHGGRIWVESKPGQGARFVFTLPKAPHGPRPT